MMQFISDNIVAILQIIWIDILLAGDNAVVIALACRSLTGRQRTIGVVLGSGAAILLRVIFTLMAATLMTMPWIKAIGAILLLWVAVKLLVPQEHGDENIKAHNSVWKAVQTIAVADLVMSLDNVLAVAAASKGSTALIVFGLIVSIPLVVFGSALLLKIIDRYPLLVWAGAALLGWVAGEIFALDSGVTGILGRQLPQLPLAILGVLFVVAAGYVIRRRRGIGMLDSPSH